MNTTNNSIEKKCYFDYLIKKHTTVACPQKEPLFKMQYNTTRMLTNTQIVTEKVRK